MPSTECWMVEAVRSVVSRELWIHQDIEYENDTSTSCMGVLTLSGCTNHYNFDSILFRNGIELILKKLKHIPSHDVVFRGIV